MRIAVINDKKCKPEKCNLECKKSCPVVKMGKLCIEVKKSSKISTISEVLCNGCGICVKKCPYNAIKIINLPKELDKQTTHRYGNNMFKLHKLPTPKMGQVLGLVGTNGTGKSTVLKILSGKIKPNLGHFNDPPSWETVITYFRGSELQNYFAKMYKNNLKSITKPQYVDAIPNKISGTVSKFLIKKDDKGIKEDIIKSLDIGIIYNKKISVLSGGELQRFAIAIVAIQEGDVYMFDEPSSSLDIKQRLSAARTIRSIVRPDNYVICVEHDLSILDYLSDSICVLYGTPGAYGIVSLPYSVRDGINIFLSGFITAENVRFRKTSLSFNFSTEEDAKLAKKRGFKKYPTVTKTFDGFKLNIEAGEFNSSEIIVLMGENGSGKSTFIRLFANFYAPDQNDFPKFTVSYKPQKILPKFKGTVRHLIHKKIKSSFINPQFQSIVFKPLGIDSLLDSNVRDLSGGEIQRVAICLALGKPADIYLIDEPSAYLDSEQRINVAKVIKHFIMYTKKTCFLVEHDIIMSSYLADKIILFEGKPSVECNARKPDNLLSGMNKFLCQLDITFRRDPTNYRPRINKHNSIKDKEQKNSGNYFFLNN